MSGQDESVDLSKLNAKDRRDIEKLLSIGRACLDDERLDPAPKGKEIVRWLIHRTSRERVHLRYLSMKDEQPWTVGLHEELFDGDPGVASLRAVKYDPFLHDATAVFDAAKAFAVELSKDSQKRAGITQEQVNYIR
jgi:hypothetical protein